MGPRQPAGSLGCGQPGAVLEPGDLAALLLLSRLGAAPGSAQGRQLTRTVPNERAQERLGTVSTSPSSQVTVVLSSPRRREPKLDSGAHDDTNLSFKLR